MNSKIGRWIFIVFMTAAVTVAGIFAIAFWADDKLHQDSESVLMENPTVDLEKFIHISTEGYDGFGRIKGNIDIVHRMDYKTITYKENAPKINSTGSNDDASTFINQNLELVFSKNENLSNGDVITYTVRFKNLVDQLVDCHFINTEGTYLVENLGEIADYDPFDNLDVTFSGISPNVHVEYNVKDSFIGRNFYVPDVVGKLKNGDKVTFAFEGDCEQLVNWFGKNVSVFHKEYEVKNMPEYVLAENELSEEMREELYGKSIEVIKNTCVAEYENTDHLEYSGCFLYVTKEFGTGKSVINRINVICKSNQIINGEEHLFYYPVSFTNLYISEGTLMYKCLEYVDYLTIVEDVSYTGIDAVDDLHAEMITCYEDDYNIVEMKQLLAGCDI